VTLDDRDLFDAPAGPRPGAAPARRCVRHPWDPSTGICPRCFKVRDAARSRRGRTNRARGNAIEREIGHRLGLRRVGQYGGPDDLSGDLFAAQVKSGGSFPERLWTWLKAVPVTANQTPLLVVTDAPGPGHRRRAVVVLDLDAWIDLHGPTGGAE
jgi:hypothetical protein